MSTLDAEVIAAHASNDTTRLVKLYTQAAEETGDVNAACFFLTHAYVFALELGHPDAITLRARLVKHGREPAS